MKRLNLLLIFITISIFSFSQVYKFEKVDHYVVDEDGSKFNDFEIVFYKVNETENTSKLRGKKFYYMSKTSEDLKNYIINNIDTNNFYKGVDDEVKTPKNLDSIEKLEDVAFNWSKVNYRNKFLLIEYNNCDSCEFNLAKDLIDQNLDEIKSIKNISNIKVITILKKRKGLLSLFGVKRVELNTVVLIESTYKKNREHGYTLIFDRHEPIINYEIYGFQPGRMILSTIFSIFNRED